MTILPPFNHFPSSFASPPPGPFGPSGSMGRTEGLCSMSKEKLGASRKEPKGGSQGNAPDEETRGPAEGQGKTGAKGGAGGAGARGGEQGGRNWVVKAAEGGEETRLKDYVDRLTSSTSSSFSSLLFFGQWSHCYDDDGGGGRATGANEGRERGAVVGCDNGVRDRKEGRRGAAR